MTTEIYTEQEKEFLIKTLDLFKVSYSIKYKEGDDNEISHWVFSIDSSDTKAIAMVNKCMAFNYERNFGR